MAIKLLVPPGEGGNNNINLGGETNPAAAATPWANPLDGATELSIAITLNPDALPGGGGNIFQNNGDQGFASTFWIRHFGGVLYCNVQNGAGEVFAERHAASVAMTVGAWNRIMFRWSGTTGTFKIQLGEQDLALAAGGSASPPSVSANADGPIEIGAISMLDALPVVGSYAEAAIWTHFKSDADALKYGQGWAPSLLDATGRVSYMTLSDKTTGVIDQWRTFTGTFYEPQNVQNATHPAVFYSPPTEEETDYIPHMHEDADSLPDDDLELYELMGFAGKRSSDPPLLVPSAMSLQAAMNTAVRGQDIVVSTTSISAPLSMPTKADRTDLLMPPKLARIAPMAPAITMAAAVNMTGVVTYGGEQVMVRVRSANSANLPKRTLRDVRHPDGSVSRLIDESAKIGPAHTGNLARVQSLGSFNWINDGWDTKGHLSQGWLLHGLKVDGPATIVADGDPDSAGPAHRGAQPDRPQRIVFLQCYIDGDPAGRGAGYPAAFGIEGSYIALIASYVDRFYTWGYGSEQTVLGGHATSPGPFHYELNTMRIPSSLAYFTGGGPANSIGVLPQNLIFRRNHQWCPYEWRKSETDPWNIFGNTGYQVTIEAHGATIAGFTKVTRVGGRAWNEGEWDNPEAQCVMYEPVTGRARKLSFRDGNSVSTVYLEEAWPGAPITTAITVYFQWASPNLVYNSGMATSTMPTATFTNGSVDVTFSDALPANVLARPTVPGTGGYYFGHYIYPNSTHNGGHAASNQALDNTWGTQWELNNPNPIYGGPFKPQSAALRQEIVEIAANRLSCKLGFAWPGATSSPPFPFSVVTHDGMFRHFRGKSFIEMKTLSHNLVEGNVVDFGPGSGTLHPTSQPSMIIRNEPQMTITGNLATITGGFRQWAPGNFGTGERDPYFMVGRRLAFGHPWPYLVIQCGTTTQDDQMFSTRTIRRFLSTTVAELEPVDPRMDINQQPTSYVGNFGLHIIETPWAQESHMVWRYNIFKSTGSGSPHYRTGQSDAPPETQMGQKYLQHDNLFIKMGDLSGYGGGSRRVGLGCDTGPYLPRPGTGWERTGDSGDQSWRHNTYAHTQLSGRAHIIFGLAEGPLAGWSFKQAKNLELNDNLALNLGASYLALIATGSVSNPVTPNLPWTTPVDLRRNIFSGPGAPNMAIPSAAHWVEDGSSGAVSAAITRFPDNTYLASDALVGAHNLANPNIDDVTNYALDDIYTTGTVAIDAGGTSVTLEGGGSFPANVAVGQFFKTIDNGTPVKIQSVTLGGIGFGPTWGANTGWAPLTVVAGKARATATGGCGLLYNHPGGGLPANQWVLAPLTHTGSPWAAGLPIRSQGNQTTTYTAYFDQSNTYIFGPGGTLLNVAFSIPTGSDVLVEAVGTLFTVSYRSTAVGGAFTFIGSMNDSALASGTTGLYIVGQSSGFTETEWGPFQTGNYVSGSRVAMATDNYTGTGAASLGLVSAYPETSVTGKSFAIGFKGTGADGRDPGANIPVLAQMIQGVTSVP